MMGARGRGGSVQSGHQKAVREKVRQSSCENVRRLAAGRDAGAAALQSQEPSKRPHYCSTVIFTTMATDAFSMIVTV